MNCNDYYDECYQLVKINDNFYSVVHLLIFLFSFISGILHYSECKFSYCL